MTAVHPKALIFDFEGTLVDFQWLLAEAEAEGAAVLANLGMIPEGQGGSYADLMNIAWRYQENFGRSDGVAALSVIYDRYDADALTRWQVRDGVRETLKEIKSRGIFTGLVSNVGTAGMSRALESLGLGPFLDLAVSRNDARWLKPHPAGLQLVCRRLGCQAKEVWYVGDSLDDIKAARNAGIPVAVVEGGQNRLSEIREAKPDWIIVGLPDLLTLLASGQEP
ncbi:MAG: HAD family hydrolase [Desulfobacteraceae bacterium]|nr:MAG: HAD family hydrolase [Desulfobacteraceae bacterium]